MERLCADRYKFSASGKRRALVATALAAAVASGAQHAVADTYTVSAGAISNVTPTGPTSGTSRVTAESPASGPTFEDFGVIDFNSGALVNGSSQLLPDGTNVSAINSFSIDLIDKAESFAVSGPVDLYLTTNTGSASGFKYQTASGPQGIGTQLDTLYSLTAAPVTYTKGATAGTDFKYSFTLSGAAQTYLINQINNGGTVRLVAAPDNATVAADWQGSTPSTGTPPLASPKITLDLTTVAAAPSNAVLTINGGTKTQSVNFARVLQGGQATAAVTLTNSGTDQGLYSVIGSTATAGTLNTAGTASGGTNPLPGTGSSPNNATTITVGMSPLSVQAGSASAATPATATVTIHNRSNTGDSTNSVVTLTADSVVASRFVNNSKGSAGDATQGAGNAPVDFGRLLVGASATRTTTLTTTNDGTATASGIDSNNLTTVTLLGATSVTGQKLNAVTNGTGLDQFSLAADGTNNVTFDNAQSTTRTVTYKAGTAGDYSTNKFYIGYGTFDLRNDDSAVGITSGGKAVAQGGTLTGAGRVYVIGTVYQAASLASTYAPATSALTLTNLAHTANNVTLSGQTTKTDIGLRSFATITNTAVVAQTGWNVTNGGIVNGAVINDGASVTGNATFDSTSKLNGTYAGNISVTAQNDQTITGAAPNDLGVYKAAFSTTVAGNTGNGSANILAGGSYAGYYISNNTGNSTRVDLLAGTSAGGNTVNITFGTGNSHALSDAATITGTTSDVHVIQFNFLPPSDGGPANSAVLAFLVNGKYVASPFGNADGGSSSTEFEGAYTPGDLTVGHYGINAVNGSVWAVVNGSGTYEVAERHLGDINFDGAVDFSDLLILAQNYNATAGQTWSTGDFFGTGSVGFNDLLALAQNYNLANLSAAQISALDAINPSFGQALSGLLDASAVPEPASLGVMALGAFGLLARRRRTRAAN